MFHKELHKLSLLFLTFLLISQITISISLVQQEPAPIVLLPFHTKSIRFDEGQEAEDYSEDYWDEFMQNITEKNVFSAYKMLNTWFYSGINTQVMINNDKYLQLFFTNKKSDFTLGDCYRNFERAIITTTYEELLKSSSLTKEKKENPNTGKTCYYGNEYFRFIGDLSYKTYVNVGEKENGLSFILNINDDQKRKVCGEIGLDLVNNKLYNTLGTNIIEQLKQKNIIKNYVWTLYYQTAQDGIIVLGDEPHVYDSNYNYRSQYKKIYVNPTQSKDSSSWAFKFHEIYSGNEENKNQNQLTEMNVELAIDQGLIIGTQDYQKYIEEHFFNYYNLMEEKICFKEKTLFNSTLDGKKKYFYVYYCHKVQFAGYNGKFSFGDHHEPFYKFPDLNFFHRTFNFTFKETKMDLWENREKRMYLMVIFDAENSNNVWKLGEPFLSKYKFVFNQDQKTLGFYNYYLPKIANSEYKDDEEQQENLKEKSKTHYWVYILIGVFFVIFCVLAYFLGKKLNETRKKKANELADDDFDYTTENKDGKTIPINSGDAFNIN